MRQELDTLTLKIQAAEKAGDKELAAKLRLEFSRLIESVWSDR